MSPAEVLNRFESLGHNCEFGLMQRHYGLEMIGLLRWGAFQLGIPALEQGLRTRLHGAGHHLSWHVNGTEYISHDDIHGIVFHTHHHVGQIEPEALIEAERVRVAYLARQLIEDIEDGEKIFVYKNGDEPTPEQIIALHATMQAIGPATLLWVTIATDPARIGTVEAWQPGILRGYIDRFSPIHDVHSDCSYDVWLQICTAALELRAPAHAA